MKLQTDRVKSKEKTEGILWLVVALMCLVFKDKKKSINITLLTRRV